MEIYPDDFFIPVNQEDEEVNVLSLQEKPSDLLKIGFTYKTQDTGFYDEPDEGELLSIQDLRQFITETIPSMFESQERQSMEQEDIDIKEEYMPFLSIKDIVDDEFRAKSQINELLGEEPSKKEIKQLLDDTIREVETRMTTEEEDPLFVIEKEQREDDVIRSKYKPITSIPAGKIYNTETGRFVSIDGAKYKKDRLTIESEKYTDDLNIINEVRKSGLVKRGKYKL
jgi:hypothetical protein